MNTKGQVVVLFAILLVGILALVSLTVDGALYIVHWQGLQTDLDAACVAAAAMLETDPAGAFYANLAANNVPETATIVAGPSNTWLTTAEGPHDFYLAQFMGFRSMDVRVESRCIKARAGSPPIVVREDWYIQSRDFGVDFPIFGHGAEAIEAQGMDFRGAILPQIWCEDAGGNVSDQCEAPRWFDPLEPTISVNQYKFIVEDLVKNLIGAPWVPPGTRVAHISGVSANPTVHAMVDAGYVIGDHILIMIFDGIVVNPDSNPRENVGILYYAEAEITMFDSNTMFAKFVGPPLFTEEEVTSLIQPRVIPWDWSE
jgi:hypothetical protein